MTDTLIIKLMSLAVHAEEYIETGEWMDAEAIKGLLTDAEVVEKRAELDAMGMLPLKR